jgi:hypothetical protein
MDRSQRLFLGCLAALAALCALAGSPQLVLYLTPLFLVVTLLLCGRFLGEERIVRHWAAKDLPPRVRRLRPRWERVGEIAPASLLQRSPVRRRGPPSLEPHAA